MATYLEELLVKLGWEVDAEDLEKFDKRTERLKKSLGGLVKVGSAVAGALTGIIAVVNRGTATTDAMARSVDLTTENAMALGAALRPIGFEMDNVIDLIEELNNKVGESTGLGEQMTAVKEATKILKLEFKDLKDLAPEEQFYSILDAALQLEDAQKAVSAVDMLTGGEGNKIIGFLRDEGKGIREIIEEYKQLNMLTQEGIDGARKMDRSVGKLLILGKSLVAEFSGQLGKVLTPIINDLIKWTIANEDLIKGKLEIWVKEVGDALVFLWEAMTSIVKWTSETIEAIGGLRIALRLLLVVILAVNAVNLALWLSSVATMAKVAWVNIGGLAGAIKILKIVAGGLKWLSILGLVALVIEDIYGMLTGKESVVGEWSKSFEKVLEEANRFWADYFDMDPEDFRGTVVEFLESDLGDILKNAGQWWSNFFGDLWDTIITFLGDVLSNAGQWWSNFFGDLWVRVSTWFKNVRDSIVGFVKDVWDTIVQYFTWMFETVTSWWSNLFKDMWDTAVQFTRGMWKELVLEYEKAIGNIVSWVEGIGESVSNFFTGIADGIRNMFKEAFGFIKSGLKTIVSILPESVQDFLGFGSEPQGSGPIGNVLRTQGQEGLTGGPLPRESQIISGLRLPTTNTVTNSSRSINVTVPTNLSVNQKGEMSPQELKAGISRAIGEEVAKAVRNNSEGVRI